MRSFNVRPLNKYDNYNNYFTYPIRVQKSEDGFYIYISLPKKERLEPRYCIDTLVNDYLSLNIHSANDMPQKAYEIPLGHKAYLTIRPNIISTDNGLIENYYKYQRKCIAVTENDLKFFKKYSQVN